MDKPQEVRNRSFPSRFIEYQRERFPFVQHAPLIVVFTFSAASYSRVCRGAEGFIPIGHFVLGALTAVFFFLLLRIFDEFKDFEEDSRFRPYRAVPRGLVSLKELRLLGIVLMLLFLGTNAVVMPGMMIAFAVVLLYMGLMGIEFGVRDWLKRRPMLYMISHMVIMPLIDFYTTGLDWLNAGVDPPRGIEFFLLVTFLNGVVIEVGRKIRAPEDEEVGVETYTALYGTKRATLGWLGVLMATWASALAAAWFAGYGMTGGIALTVVLALCSLPAIAFLRRPDGGRASRIEKAAGVWTIGMYLTLGAVPMILRWLG